MSRARSWCFTVNNWTQTQHATILSLTNEIKYLVVGKETSESGTPHLQGFVTWKSPRSLAVSKRALGGEAHLEVARNIKASIDYCKKDDDFVELGTPPKQGKRSDLDIFLQAVKEDPKRALKDLEFRFEHATVFARYKAFAEDLIERSQPKKAVDLFPLRDWQRDLCAALNQQPDTRTITFIVDSAGNKGKTWFAFYYQSLHEDVDIIIPGKKADMAHKLIHHPRVVIFDAPRSKQGEFIQYDFLEEVKNGYVFSPKYNSKIKTFKAPHVVVMMNEYPDMRKLSEDRYNIITL